MRDKKDRYELERDRINKQITENIKKLLKNRKCEIPEFIKAMEEKGGFCSIQYFRSLLNKPENTHISLALVMMCCDYFGVSLDNIVSDKFDANQRIQSEKELYKLYLGTEELAKERSREEVSRAVSNYENMGLNIESETIITNPKHKLFRGYLQDYHCYYYPTSSRENKEHQNMIQGILSLTDQGDHCEAILKVDSSLHEQDVGNYDKIYKGTAVISTTGQCMYCFMFGEEMGEFSVISFRHFAMLRRSSKLFCRMAVALSSSSGSEERRPTVLRILLSSEEIKKEHRDLIGPAIQLNYSRILVSKQMLEALCEEHKEYSPIGDRLAEDENVTEMLILHEQDDVYRIAKKYLHSREAALEFVMRLREISYSYRYNKVSSKADKNITDLLVSKGYYKT